MVQKQTFNGIIFQKKTNFCSRKQIFFRKNKFFTEIFGDYKNLYNVSLDPMVNIFLIKNCVIYVLTFKYEEISIIGRHCINVYNVLHNKKS